MGLSFCPPEWKRINPSGRRSAGTTRPPPLGGNDRFQEGHDHAGDSGSSFLPGPCFSSTLMQGAGILQGISMFETMPWREIGLTAAILLGAWLVRRVGRLFIAGTVENRVVQYRWGKTLAYLTLTLATVFIIAIWVDGLSQIGTFLGLVSAGVAIALKDLLVDFAGWLMLITKPPVRGWRPHPNRASFGRRGRHIDPAFPSTGDRQLGGQRPEHWTPDSNPQREDPHRSDRKLHVRVPVLVA